MKNDIAVKHFLLVITAVLPAMCQLNFYGNIPAGINKLDMAAQYSRIYRLIAPQKKPDRSPLKIIYYSQNSKPQASTALPEWGGGGAIGGNLIIIPTDVKPFLRQDFSQITVHELVHAVICRAYPDVNVPRWFNEGTAMLLSGELSFEETAILSRAVFMSRLLSLDKIDSVNNYGRAMAELAYSQSHAALLCLVSQYGMEIISDCLKAAQKKKDFYIGIQSVAGLSKTDVEDLIRNNISSKYRLALLFSDSSTWWVIISLLFITGFIITVRRNRRRADEMKKQESLAIADELTQIDSKLTDENKSDQV
jgi:hypothetical protein